MRQGEDLTQDAPAVTDSLERQARGARRLSLRARLGLLVVASIVPLTAFVLARVYLNYQHAVEDSGEKTLELARGLSIMVEKDLQARIAVLQVLALSRSLREGDLSAFRTEAEAVVADQFPGATIVLLREDGQQVMSTRTLQGATLPVRRYLETVRQVFATGRPAVSDVYQGVVAGGPAAGEAPGRQHRIRAVDQS